MTMIELDRIAQLSYYSMHSKILADERDELIGLLIKWKVAYDKNRHKNKHTS